MVMKIIQIEKKLNRQAYIIMVVSIHCKVKLYSKKLKTIV